MREIIKIINKNKKLIAILLVATSLVGVVSTAETIWATSASKKKQEAQNKLNKVQEEIKNLQNKNNKVESQIKDAKKQSGSYTKAGF